MTGTGKKLVIVESPTKAKTIRKFLGKDFIVESCMGHVRDLPQSAREIPEKFKKEKWAHLGVNVDEGFVPVYCIPKAKIRIVKALKDKLKEASELWLATDEDREGESISWHLVEVLKPRIPVKRMVFHEITKEAIEKALKDTRDVDENLVRAQEARRILDRLVGYTISPLLWKKVAYGLSAGRVQSVAVRLIAERELERLQFKRTQYWGLAATNAKEKIQFESRLLSVNAQRVAIGKDFDGTTGLLKADKSGDCLHLKEQQVNKIKEQAEGRPWVVKDIEEKPVSRKPAAPFITSTLQQESNRKLGLSSKETMELAQKLYERGFITYMRTDSTALSAQAITAARSQIESLYGKSYLPEAPRDYSSKKSKGAQEAHEAIRPAGTEFMHPEQTGLSGAMQRLYELIWKRTLASQMPNSEHKQVSVKFEVGDLIFSANGMTIEFPGFLKAYVEGTDDPDAALEEKEVRLPQLKKGDRVDCLSLKVTDHETKPPARYTEATLVQTMEKEGIGRPSTYAAIISTIQNRGYVKKAGNALVPTFTALVVSKLLSKSLPDYVDVRFTSQMEEKLDEIASGDHEIVKYLTSIYFGNQGLKTQVEKQEGLINDDESRSIVLSGLENLVFKIGRYGAYVCRLEKSTGEEVCVSLPDNQVPGDLTSQFANKLLDQKVSGTDAIGKDPHSGLPVYVLTGRYGPYVQLGEGNGAETKPKRMAIPAMFDPEKITLQEALDLLSLPKVMGLQPQTGKEVKVGLGRFGPFVFCDGEYRSIPKGENLFQVTFERALELLAQPKRVRGGSTALKDLGKHPETGEAIAVFTGKYGPYVKCGKINASLSDEMTPEEITMAQALELLEARAGAKRSKKSGGKKASTKAPAKAKRAKPVVEAAAEEEAEDAPVAKPPVSDAKKKVIRRRSVQVPGH